MSDNSPPATVGELNWQRLVRLLRDERCVGRHDLMADAAKMIERLARHVDDLTSAPSAEAVASRDAIGELLAILNRDGGHRQAEVGRQQAARDAIAEVQRMRQVLAEHNLLDAAPQEPGSPQESSKNPAAVAAPVTPSTVEGSEEIERLAKTVERVAREQKLYRETTIADLKAAAAALRSFSSSKERGEPGFYEHWLNVLAQECFGDERPENWVAKLAVRVRELNQIPSASECTSWQPIETAPKTGPVEHLLLYVPALHGTGGPVIAHWAHGGGEDQPAFGPSWFFWSGYDFRELTNKPTHWMRLPHCPADWRKPVNAAASTGVK